MRVFTCCCLLMFLFINIQLSAQDVNCANHYMMNESYKELPKPSSSHSKSVSEDIYLRTVVHNLYHDSADSLSTDEINKLLDGLNDLFSGSNIDTNRIWDEHKPIIANTGIQFCLASSDPDGAFTDGINYRKTDIEYIPYITTNGQVGKEAVKSDADGGYSPWDINRYFNIWLAPMESASAKINYAIPHDDFWPVNMFLNKGIPGVVITVPINNMSGNSNLLAHECGHALGLMHTFGAVVNAPSCDLTDYISDTPPMSFNLNCKDQNRSNTCVEDVDDKFDNVSNIMNYGCQLMFTLEQAEVMRNNILNTTDLDIMIPMGTSCNKISSISEAKSSDLEIILYPNPAMDIISINASETINAIEIYNIAGQLIDLKSYALGEAYTEIDVSNLMTGVYIFRCHSNDKMVIKRVVIE